MYAPVQTYTARRCRLWSSNRIRVRERESNALEQCHQNDQFSVLQITKDQRDLIQTEDVRRLSLRLSLRASFPLGGLRGRAARALSPFGVA